MRLTYDIYPLEPSNSFRVGGNSRVSRRDRDGQRYVRLQSAANSGCYRVRKGGAMCRLNSESMGRNVTFGDISLIHIVDLLMFLQCPTGIFLIRFIVSSIITKYFALQSLLAKKRGLGMFSPD